MKQTLCGFSEIVFPSATLIDKAAEEILHRFAAAPASLANLTVVLPNLHAAAGVKRALGRAAGDRPILLPRFTTLAGLSASVVLEGALDRPLAAASLRLAQLYAALKARGWFDPADLWAISAELVLLFDDLTRANAGLADDIDDFVAMLARAYQARRDDAMHFEARLAHEMWYAARRPDLAGETALDGVAAHFLRLKTLARAPCGPLCAIGLVGLAPAEAAFLRDYAERESVLVIGVDATRFDSAVGAALGAAWSSEEGHAPSSPILQRAAAFAQEHPVSPLPGRLALVGAANLEEEASVAAAEIKRQIAQGHRDIALVAADRLVARRVRALLERDAILLADESGWTLSTTSASTIVMRLLDTITGGFHHRDVLDLLKSPFFAADWPAERRKHAVHRLERWIRERNVVGGLARLAALAALRSPHGDEVALIGRLEIAAARLKTARRPLAGWLDHLAEALQAIGATAGLQADAAGRHLLELIALRAQELAGHSEPVSLAEWRRWLNAELETATFRDLAIDSPVVLTTLAATRLRRFDAVILVGADALHLDARPSTGRLFNQAVRRELGLPGVRQAAEEMQQDLLQLVVGSGRVLMTWQTHRNSEENAASPWLIRLQAFHALAYGVGLRGQAAAAHVVPPAHAPRRPPSPALPPALLPTTISASGYGALMACPYQFFARFALRLRESEEISEEMEKREYGQLIHAVLARFHERHPRLAALTDSDATAALTAITDEVLAEQFDNNTVSLAWKLRWQKRIGAYLAWQRARESNGWYFDAAEKSFEQTLSLAGGRAVTLRGRVDRIDRRAADGQRAVLDYKTQRRHVLVDKLAIAGEDVQLAVYALLVGGDVVEAAYVGVDEEKAVHASVLGDDLPALVEASASRLGEALESVVRGRPLPAQGAPVACRFCEMRGLCRRDYWDVSPDSPDARNLPDPPAGASPS